ncbi:sensor histidine kinase [Streptomyces sp. KR80]|uniref:sensor histidine kinase n=1 Tax=Streptomyces sp. KR80 TaxID=3457426 RepID=UPI003FD04994
MPNPRSTPGGAAPQPPPPARGRRAHARPPAEEADPPNDSAARRSTAASWYRIRPRSVRAKIVCLLMVPVVSLLALWASATVGTAQDAARLRAAQRVDTQVRAPVAAAVDAVQQERVAAVRQLAAPTPSRAADLAQAARPTDRALRRLRLGSRHTVADAADLPTAAARGVNTFVTRAEGLAELRTRIENRRADWDEVYDAYTDAIDAALEAMGGLAGVQDVRSTADGRMLLELARSRELLARENALLTSAQLTGSLDANRHRRFAGAVEARRTFEEAAAAGLRGADRERWEELSDRGAYAHLRAVEDRVLRAAPGRKAAEAAPTDAWERPYDTLRGDLRALENGAHRAAEQTDPLARALVSPAGAAVLLGLAAVVASLVISVRIGRGLVVELVALRNRALELARHELPHAMRKLRAGEDIDIRAEAPAGPPAEDEVGQVGEALGSVHRAALRAAVERADLADAVAGVFVNLARRSQVLVHRQLALLDRMERRAEDPGELGDLFRLDHLTTRMRRYAESLIILSGAAPGRAWRTPVSLTSVVRAAVSEVEDYARVELLPLPEASVAGSAVADLTHLLAELIENAAQFSPPHTKVRIGGEPVGNGYALEVEDRGLGMGEDTLTEANRRITQSEALDLFDSDRLGLFVVNRLSARHGVRVTLRPSPYGGTTAVVVLPRPLLRASETSPKQQQRREDERTADPVKAAGPGGDAMALPGPCRNAGRRPIPGPRTVPEPEVPGPPPGRPGPGESSSEGGPLPRRVRQASLAPQLREAPPPEPEAHAAPSEEAPQERTPELARARMAAYRDGWVRGGGPAAPPSEGDRE